MTKGAQRHPGLVVLLLLLTGQHPPVAVSRSQQLRDEHEQWLRRAELLGVLETRPGSALSELSGTVSLGPLLLTLFLHNSYQEACHTHALRPQSRVPIPCVWDMIGYSVGSGWVETPLSEMLLCPPSPQ